MYVHVNVMLTRDECTFVCTCMNMHCFIIIMMNVLLCINIHIYRELFNAAFVSCWMELRPVHQEDFVSNLKQALTLQNIPEITQTVLNLAEFMEHCEEATVSQLSCSNSAQHSLN